MVSITGSNGMQALHAHQANMVELGNSLRHLATGQRITRAADDPAGMVSAEQLKAAIAVLEAESRSAERSQHIAASADAALGEISDRLVDLRGLAVANANTGAMSDAEREANQIEMDAIIQSVNRIAGSAMFNGEKLLDGELALSVASDSLVIDEVSASVLGTLTEDGDIDVSLADLATGGRHVGDDAIAGDVVEAAAQQVSTMRGRLGAFQSNAIQSHIRSAGVALTNTYSAFSQVSDTDFAAETARLARAETLQRTSLMVLAEANDTHRQTVLGLLG
ncbi:MAG: hypothetical protein KAS72_04705 [Phycisphaerales bacterium]|nr:hypothetical protein [Phycisphaerales bacterium]